MSNRDRIVNFRCFDTCHYALVWPTFFLEASKAKLRTLFKWLFAYEWYSENEETIAFLDHEFPILFETIEKEDIPNAKEQWDKRSQEYQRDFLTTDSRFFPSEFSTKKEKQEEKERRKNHNSILKGRVNAAKADYEYQKKRLVRAKEIYEIYKSEK